MGPRTGASLGRCPLAAPLPQPEIGKQGWAAHHAQEAKAAFDRRMLNKRPLDEPAIPTGGADAPAAGAAVYPLPGVKGPPVKEPPGQPLAAKPVYQQPPPPVWQGSSTDEDVPVKSMPKRSPQPCAYTDYRYGGESAAGATMQPDAVVQEQADRLEAARRRAEAAGPAGDKPCTTSELEYFIKGQQSMARPLPDPWGQPAGIAMVGKGKGKAPQPPPHGDPWSGMAAWCSREMGKGKGCLLYTSPSPRDS